MKNKVVLAQPAATAPRLVPRAPGPVRGAAGGGGSESYRARLRHRSLLQDYKEILKSSEEMEEFHDYQQSVAAGPSDAETPAAFWGVRNPGARAGKRKISWQDQLVLRV